MLELFVIAQPFKAATTIKASIVLPTKELDMCILLIPSEQVFFK